LEQEENEVDLEIEQLQQEKKEMEDLAEEEKKDAELKEEIEKLEEQEQQVEAEMDEDKLNLDGPNDLLKAMKIQHKEEATIVKTHHNTTMNHNGLEDSELGDDTNALLKNAIGNPDEKDQETTDSVEEEPAAEEESEEPVVAVQKPDEKEPHETAHNLMGGPLQKCSSDGMALTGYIDKGYCVFEEAQDHGHHTICIALHETVQPGRIYGEYDFCEVTDQTDPTNWCDSLLPCHQDQNELCPVEEWCVSQANFADFLEKVGGGCDMIGTMFCEATNQVVISHLEGIVNRDEDEHMKYELALACIKQRCGQDIHN